MDRLTLEKTIGKTGVFIDGDWIESKDQDPDGEVRLIQLADIGDGNFINKSHRFLTQEKAHLLQCTFLEPGDILIARMPDPIGRSCILPDLGTLCVTAVDICVLRIDPTIVRKEWLKYMINSKPFRNNIEQYISGATRKRISRSNLAKIEFAVPPLSDQDKAIAELDQANLLIQKRKESIKLLDEYLKSVFLEMFGDPVRNQKGWGVKQLKEFGEIITGNTPPRNENLNYNSNFIEWIKTDNIIENNVYLAKATEHLSELGLSKGRKVSNGALLVACIAGSLDSIGRSAITNRDVAFNQQINAIQPSNEINPVFLYWLFKLCRKYIQGHATKGMKRILTKGGFEKIKMIFPPLAIQIKFADIALKNAEVSTLSHRQLKELETNFQHLMEKTFYE